MRGGWSVAKFAKLLVAVLLLATHATGTDLEGFDDEDDEQLAVQEQDSFAENNVEVPCRLNRRISKSIQAASD